MNEALICIGSNENKEYNMSECRRLLEHIFSDITYSDICISIPYGKNYKNDFLNQLAIIKTDKEKIEFESLLKDLEKQLRRNPEDKIMGIVKIDIDLIIWNGLVTKPEDLSRSYVQALIHELAEYENFHLRSSDSIR